MDRDWKGMHDWQWSGVRELFPPKKTPFLKRLRKGGRPRADNRQCLEAILWSARTGLSPRRHPGGFARGRTVSRRLAQWHRSGRLHGLWKRFLEFTGPTEREDWRQRLADACGHSPAFWRLELRAILDINWPSEKRYT
jgi:transposase